MCSLPSLCSSSPPQDLVFSVSGKNEGLVRVTRASKAAGNEVNANLRECHSTRSLQALAKRITKYERSRRDRSDRVLTEGPSRPQSRVQHSRTARPQKASLRRRSGQVRNTLSPKVRSRGMASVGRGDKAPLRNARLIENSIKAYRPRCESQLVPPPCGRSARPLKLPWNRCADSLSFPNSGP